MSQNLKTTIAVAIAAVLTAAAAYFGLPLTCEVSEAPVVEIAE